MHKSVIVSFSIFILCMFAGCAPKGYRDAVTTAVRLENQRDYEKAYDYYKQALRAKPDDAQIKRKLDELGETIAVDYTEKAIQAFENKKHKTALELLRKALAYDENNKKANDYKREVSNEYEKIKEKYSQAEGFTQNNKWVEAVNTLKEISELYNDDPDLENQIGELQNVGYRYYMEAGFNAGKEGAYPLALRCFESADALKTSDESQQEISTAGKYVEADTFYRRAEEMADKNNLLEAMAALIQSKEIVDDHLKVNQLIVKLAPDWSPVIFEKGRKFMDSGQTDEAYGAFYSLNKINPEYPEAGKYFEEIRSKFLQENYRRLTDAQKAGDYSLVLELSKRILKEDPAFLDTREIMTRTVISAFNIFYQQGLYYLQTGNYGKAVLCFRSAEQQLSETRITRLILKKAWDQIKKGSALNAVFLDFSQEIGDPSVSKYITWKIKEGLKGEITGNRLKNITVEFEGTKEDDLITISGATTDIDWGAVLSRGFNAVITGKIRLLKQDTSVNSEWKTRKRTVRKIVDNEAYTRLIIRQADLRTGMKSKNWRKEKRMSKSQIARQLELIEERLLTIPPKIEAEVKEETPFQLVNHTMTAYMHIDIKILAPDGSHIWPMKRYEDVYQIEDSVVPPNLMSDDPEERMGDPLTLPSEYEFKEQAIDHIVKNKIMPELIGDFRGYGMRFYKKATNLSRLQDKSKFDNAAFLDSFEEYYKFLACYED
ncbi:MAG: hypothetical protein JRJ20_00805, partial [Deltaproteobacteria bacterium]|nr:hypothetical protein [Deltaproteobacteria bacterium]